MNFFKFSFTYIFKAYQNWGERYSAHIYALCAITLLMGCNFLSIFFIMLSKNYLKSSDLKGLVLITFAILLISNAFYFLKGAKYLRIADKYNEMSSNSKSKMKVAFWSYFVITIVVLIFTM